MSNTNRGNVVGTELFVPNNIFERDAALYGFHNLASITADPIAAKYSIDMLIQLLLNLRSKNIVHALGLSEDLKFAMDSFMRSDIVMSAGTPDIQFGFDSFMRSDIAKNVDWNQLFGLISIMRADIVGMNMEIDSLAFEIDKFMQAPPIRMTLGEQALAVGLIAAMRTGAIDMAFNVNLDVGANKYLRGAIANSIELQMSFAFHFILRAERFVHTVSFGDFDGYKMISDIQDYSIEEIQDMTIDELTMRDDGVRHGLFIDIVSQ